MHLTAKISLLAFACFCLVACHRSGTWDESPGNWERAFNGQPQPPDTTVHHSYYWRSPHFTYEASYFFELSMPQQSLEEWIRYQKLTAANPGEQRFLALPNQPAWFVPKPADSYDMWIAAYESYSNFRLYQDRTTKRVFVCDQQ